MKGVVVWEAGVSQKRAVPDLAATHVATVEGRQGSVERVSGPSSLYEKDEMDPTSQLDVVCFRRSRAPFADWLDCVVGSLVSSHKRDICSKLH